jgi:hypothetical protein
VTWVSDAKIGGEDIGGSGIGLRRSFIIIFLIMISPGMRNAVGPIVVPEPDRDSVSEVAVTVMGVKARVYD